MKAGVERYTAGRAEVTVYFPDGELFCKWCWAFLQCDSDLRRYRCKLTEEPIPDPQHTIGHRCPLIFYEKEDTHGNPCDDSGGERDG